MTSASPVLLTPAQWAEREGIVVLDPDGWRWDGKSMEEPIDSKEWYLRMSRSTIRNAY